jgi:phage terminase large subunit-like protein
VRSIWSTLVPILRASANSDTPAAIENDRFRAGVLEEDLTHDGSPVLAAHIGHCAAKDTPHGTIVTKAHPDSPRKIDAAVAAVVAYERACWHAATGSEAFVAFA